MKRIFQWILSLSAAAGALLLTSCGCCGTSESVPPLRPLPKFQEIPQEEPHSAKTPIHYAK